MLATVNIVHNPFHPTLDRQQVALKRRYKVSTIAKRQRIDFSKPVMCYYNGTPLLRKDWDTTIVDDAEVLAFVYLPQGGGGSNPLKIVLMISLAAFAPAIAGAIGAKLGVAAGTFGASLIKAGVGLLGNALINALIPPPQPPKPQQRAQAAAPSPTYNLSAQGNQARIGQSIPVLYGEMRIFPDFAAQPYAEYESNQQYLYQLFCLTQGEATFDNADVYIEDTPIVNFGADHEIELIRPNQTSALFPNEVFNVSEVSGQELTGPNAVGYFPVNPPETTVNKLSFDMVMPQGLGYVGDDGELDSRTVTFRFNAQLIDDAGNTLGAPFTLATRSISARTNTAIRRTYSFAVTAGRYQIQVFRIGSKSSDARFSNTLNVTAARGYSSEALNYGNITLMAVKLRANNTLSSQSSRKINVLAKRMLPVPSISNNIVSWGAPQVTQSIAWAIADMCRAHYGAGVSEARFNVAQLIALHDLWNPRGDTLNCTFDSAQTFWEALSITCRAGRARPFVQGGMMHFVRDSLQQLPSVLFTQRNIVKDTFKLSYIMPSEDTADAVDVEYFDQEIWKPKVVRAQLDVGTPNKPIKIQAFGITNRDQAYREGMKIAADNRYRRKEISFNTELEGHIPSLGDLIAIQHDMPEWGQYGEALSVTATTVQSSEPFEWETGATHYMMLRTANGGAEGPIAVTRGANDGELVFVSGAVQTNVYTGNEREKTYITFGREGRVVQLARLLSARPLSNGQVEISAINEDPRVHSADGTPVPIDDVKWALPAPTSRPVLSAITVAQTGSGLTPDVLVSWDAVPGAGRYIVQTSRDNEHWETRIETEFTSYAFLATPGMLYVQVAAYGGVLGPFVGASIDVGTVAPPPDVATGAISANGQMFNVSWQAVNDSDAYRVRVRHSNSVKREFTTTSTFFDYSLENAIADGGPWRTINVQIFALKGGVSSANPLTLTGNNAAPPRPTVILVPGQGNIAITVSPSSELDYAGTRIHAGDTAGFTPDNTNLIYDGPGSFYLYKTDAEKYIKAAHYDTYGKTGLNYSLAGNATPNTDIGGIEVFDAFPTTGNFVDRTVYLTTTKKLYTFNGTGWDPAGSEVADGSITSAKLAANAVTANKIQVANLAAINANMGAITAGSITLDNAGFIRGGQTAFGQGAGFHFGYSSGQYRMSVGDGTRGITWSDGALNVSGNINLANGGHIASGWHVGRGGHAWPDAGHNGMLFTDQGLLIGNKNDGQYFSVDTDGNLEMPGMKVENETLTISQVDVIDTLNVRGDAINVVSSSVGASGNFPSFNAWQTVVSTGIITSGQPTSIIANVGLYIVGFVSTPISGRILRNGSVICTMTLSQSFGYGDDDPYYYHTGRHTMAWRDFPVAGSHTYTLQIYVPSSNTSVGRRRYQPFIEVKEVKR